MLKPITLLPQKIAILILSTLITSSPSSGAEPTASFQGLGDLAGGDFYSAATSISADGSTVVGYSHVVELEGGNSAGYEAFRWTRASGTIAGLGVLSGGEYNSLARDVSADGSIVVGFSWSAVGVEAFRWSNDTGTMVGLGDYPSGGFFSTDAQGVSPDGSFVVGCGDENRSRIGFWWAANSGEMEDLGDLSCGYAASTNGSIVVGSSGGGYGGSEWAHLWTRSDGVSTYLGDLEGGIEDSRALAISGNESTIVGYGTSEAGREATLWTADGEVMLGLGDLPGGEYSSWALDISYNASVIVGYGTSASGSEAFLWIEGSGMLEARNYLESAQGLDLTGWALTQATGISDDGLTIVGNGINPQGNTEAWIATIIEPVPEPTRMAMLTAALLTLLSLRTLRWRCE